MEQYVYIFIRQDLPVEHQIVQSNHATYCLVRNAVPLCECPNIVAIGVPDLAALKRVERKLKDNRIPHFPWYEPDLDLGFTAIATAPISGEQREVLSNYRLLKHNSPGAEQSACSVTADRGAKAAVAQLESSQQ